MKLIYSFLVICTTLFFCGCSDDDDNSATNASKVTASILRDKVTKSATFIIEETDQTWKLYAGNSIAAIDEIKPILEGTGKGLYSLDVSNSTRSYFKLVTSDGYNTYLSETHLPMTGGYNFRDLGGVETKDGKYVKWGMLFRSDESKTLTSEDLVYLSSIPLLTQVDFRSAEEIEAAPNKKASSIKDIYTLSITPGNLTLDFENFDVSIINTFMTDLNLQLVSDSVSIEQYKKFFELVQNENSLPLIYNCSAGKDRTGMATALIYYALNVDEEVIFNDYLASNIYLEDKYANLIATYPQLKPIFEVRREFLQTGIDKIKSDYGTVENYLVTVLNVDLNKMRQIYLY